MVQEKKEEKLFSGVVQLKSKVIGLILGLFLGLSMFIMTNVICRGESAVNERGEYIIDPILYLLSQIFVGYSCSFLGSIIGFLYGFAIGTISGAVMAWIYNKIVEIRN